tara:strand:+ start:2998 stop:3516 length:519 start_codon:yes stop_codon:yes gene_type:complete
MNLHFIDKKEVFPIVLILILALSRLLPHPPNFTPIITIGIMSSYFFKNIFSSLIILLISMLLSDLFIGFYKNMVFVYLSLILITCIFFKIIKKANYSSLLIYSFFGSLLFYLVSNFGVWLTGDMYEKNINGLVNCYLMAIPFFRNTLISTIIFTYATFFTNSICLKNYKSSS